MHVIPLEILNKSYCMATWNKSKAASIAAFSSFKIILHLLRIAECVLHVSVPMQIIFRLSTMFLLWSAV